METWQVITLLLTGLGLLATAVFIRARFGEKYELKSIDLVLLIVPLLFVLLVTGKLQIFEAFGVRADFSQLFAEAAAEDIDRQVTNTASPGVDELVTLLETAAKAGVQEIPRLMEQKTEALVFRLGHGGYYGPAIEQYFNALYASSYLQYLIILTPEGQLFGLYDALDLAVYFRTEGNGAYEDFAYWLNQASPGAEQSLARLPGFISAEASVFQGWSKRRALEAMDDLGLDTLPVVDEDGQFVGLVERGQLTTSLILQVARQLDGTEDGEGL